MQSSITKPTTKYNNNARLYMGKNINEYNEVFFFHNLEMKLLNCMYIYVKESDMNCTYLIFSTKQNIFVQLYLRTCSL